MNEEYSYKYTAYITATGKPQPISAEWGEDSENDAVDIKNPLTMIADGTCNGVAVAAGQPNAGNILIGNKNGQTDEYLPGGNTGVVGMNRLSDYWIKTVDSRDSIRVAIKVYGRKE